MGGEARQHAEVARWPNGAKAPVCLMVDDLTDGWIDADGSGRPLAGNDWGFACATPGSSFDRLQTRILERFPGLHVTFFVPVDRLPDLDPPQRPTVFHAIDARPEFRGFLGKLAADPRIELAYHGCHHGRGGARAEDYVPEFAGYASVDEALAGIERGREIWRRALGSDPDGGKYPAYQPGAFGDEAISRAGFAWWCRTWDRGARPAGAPGAFEPSFFGAPPVVDLPSTLHTPRWPAILVRRLLRSPQALETQLDALLAGGDPITIQEHIAWSRPDPRRQRPNVQDDEPALIRLLGRLEQRPVWHATCGEIAEYFEARARTALTADAAGFTLGYAGRGAAAPRLSLSIAARPRGGVAVLDGPRGRIGVPIASADDGAGRLLTARTAWQPGRYVFVDPA